MNVNEFYVTLLSDNSMNVYTYNVQSSFTNIVNIGIKTDESWEVGLTEIFLNNAELVDQNSDVAGIEHPISITFVYTDIMKPRCVGDKKPKCLRLFAFNGRRQTQSFHNVEYYPVDQTTIKDISILITDANGKKIKFKQSFTPIYATLHFRRKTVKEERGVDVCEGGYLSSTLCPKRESSFFGALRRD